MKGVLLTRSQSELPCESFRRTLLSLTFLPNAMTDIMWTARFIWKICRLFRKCCKRNIHQCLIILQMQRIESINKSQNFHFRGKISWLCQTEGDSNKKMAYWGKNFPDREKQTNYVTSELMADSTYLGPSYTRLSCI